MAGYVTASGEPLPAFPELAAMIRNRETPGSRYDPTWTYTFLEKELGGNELLMPSMWDCVLSLWRLKELAPEDGDGVDEQVWQEHVFFWLVRRFQWAYRWRSALIPG